MTLKTLEQTQSSSQLHSPSVNLDALQHHTRPDTDIAADLQCVLEEDRILCGTADRIDTRVNAGVVCLSGYVATSSHKVRAETDQDFGLSVPRDKMRL